MSAAEPDFAGERTVPEAAREAARARRRSRPWPVRLAGIALGLALTVAASCLAAAAAMLCAYAFTTPSARIHTLTDGCRKATFIEVQATPGDVVITCGAGHYPGFRRLLGPGWREVATQDNPVFR